MNQKTIKILSMMFTVLALVVLSTNVVLAAYTPNNFAGTTEGVEGLNTLAVTGNKIIGIIQTVGMIVSVVVIMILGIKYMMGSAEEKASYKKTMVPYVIGAILIFGASAFATTIYNFALDLK